jgi:hypothetical protein
VTYASALVRDLEGHDSARGANSGTRTYSRHDRGHVSSVTEHIVGVAVGEFMTRNELPDEVRSGRIDANQESLEGFRGSASGIRDVVRHRQEATSVQRGWRLVSNAGRSGWTGCEGTHGMCRSGGEVNGIARNGARTDATSRL